MSRNARFALLVALSCCISAAASASPELAADSAAPNLSAVTLAAGAPLPSLVPPGPAGYIIRHIVPEVRIRFTVSDARGRLLNSITRDQLRIYDNRVAVPSIGEFSQSNDLPLQVAIVLDVSESVQKTRQQEVEIALYFLTMLFRSDYDQAALLTFSKSVEVRQGFTRDTQLLAQALGRPSQARFMTSLYDAIYETSRLQFPNRAADSNNRRILLLVSDGVDTGSRHTLADALRAAQENDVQIIALALHPALLAPEGDATLQQLADASGGQFIIVPGPKDFAAAFAAIEQQARTEYAVSFHPSTSSLGRHDVSIAVAASEKLKVRARQSYFVDEP